MSRIKKLWPLWVLIAIWGLFFWKFLFKGLLPIPADITVGMYFPWLDYQWGYSTGVPVKNPLPSDIPSIVYPWRMAVVEALKGGHWPLWNSGYFLGMPLLANFQSAVFSVSNLFFWFLSFSRAWSWGVVCQSLFSLLAMFAFLKNKKLTNWSSILGSVIFSFSGFAIAWQQYNVHGWTMAFSPLIFLTIDKYLSNKNVRWLFLLSLLIAGQIFSGYLPIVIYTFLTVLGYLLVTGRLFNRTTIRLSVFVLLGLMIAAVQLLPGSELVSRSIRNLDPTALGQVGYLPIRQLISLAIPNFFGSTATGNYWGRPFLDNFSFWVGIIPVVLAFLAVRIKTKKRESFFWVLLVLIGLLMALENPLSPFLQKIFLLKGGIPSRALFLVDLGIAVLAAIGFDELLRRPISVGRKQVFWAGLLLLVSILPFFWVYYQAEPVQRLIALRNSVLPVSTALLFLVGWALTVFYKRFVKTFPVLVIFLVTINLWHPAQKYWSFVPDKLVFPTTPIIEFLKSDQNIPFRLEPGNVIPQNMWTPYGLEAVSGYDTLMPERQGQFLSLVKTGSLAESVSRVQSIDNYQSILFPLLNVKYFLVKKTTADGFFRPEGKVPEQWESPRFKRAFEDKTIVVYQDSQFFPRVWSVDKLVTLPDDQSVAKALVQPNFKMETAIVTRSGTSMVNEIELFPAEIKFLNYRPGFQEILVNNPGPSFLVESASFYPGWRAFDNGREIEIYQTDYGLRGYFLPEAGEHRLKLVYDPISFKIGLLISLLSLFFWFFGMFLFPRNLFLFPKKHKISRC